MAAAVPFVVSATLVYDAFLLLAVAPCLVRDDGVARLHPTRGRNENGEFLFRFRPARVQMGHFERF